MHAQRLLQLGFLSAPAVGHFHLLYPAGRDIVEEQEATFPCGSNNTVSPMRTMWPITGGSPIQIDNEHTESEVQVLIAIGNNPGDAYNTVLVPTFQTMGPNEMCIGRNMVTIPQMIGGVKIEDGVNATLQVVTSGDDSGGLYNCADITFTSTPLTQQQYNEHCVTSDGVISRTLPNGNMINANGTTIGASMPSGSSSSNGSGGNSSASSARVGLGLLSAALVAAVTVMV